MLLSKEGSLLKVGILLKSKNLPVGGGRNGVSRFKNAHLQLSKVVGEKTQESRSWAAAAERKRAVVAGEIILKSSKKNGSSLSMDSSPLIPWVTIGGGKRGGQKSMVVSS